MTKKVITTEQYTCDLCGKICVPVKQITLFHSGTKDYSNEIILKIEVSVPYSGEGEKHSCRDCLEKCMKNSKVFV